MIWEMSKEKKEGWGGLSSHELGRSIYNAKPFKSIYSTLNSNGDYIILYRS